MLVKDLVWLDEEGKFRNDVQLSHFENQKINKSLVGCYIFSFDAPRGYLSSVDLLRSIIYAYVNPTAHKNRTVVIGQYGHGKSHLGLVMANYLGKPHTSTEFKTVIERLERAIDNPAKLELYKEFRKNRPEFLVIRLSGDNPRSLREQFMQALEKGLKEHEATKNTEMPFWQETAKRLLSCLEGSLLEKANNFLEQYSTEVVLLAQEVETYSDQTYRMVVELFTHLHGVAPNLGGEISMKEVLNWAAEKFCGKEGPLGGIFIPFDEFSLFIQNQSKRGGSGELQDLLNGVQDQAGKAVFVAFSQHDPKAIARSVLQGVGLANIEKELNRIEGELILYSLMESVIDAYLKQSDNNWTILRSDPKVRGPLTRASDLCMQVFSKRYEDTFRWGPEIFDEIVQKGCFPLHPITTAILCDIQLQAVQRAGNPRTVLGFVERVVRERADFNALLDNGRLNWVHAIELVDYFYDYLPESPRVLYETAKRSLSAESPDEFDMIFKALLLEEIIQIRRDSRTQIEFLAEVAGLEVEDALEHLKKMARAHIIRYDPISRLNTFMPAMSDPNRMRELLNAKRSEFKWDWNRLQELNKRLEFKSIDVHIEWGHPGDWGAAQHILIPDFFDEEHLRLIAKNWEIVANGFKEGDRGVVVWLLARTVEEVAELRASANKIIDDTFSEEHPIPLLAILPERPCPDVLESFETLISLDNFSNEERKEVGQAVYLIQVEQAKKAIKEGIDLLRGDVLLYRTNIRKSHSITTPKAYRAVLQSRGDINLIEALGIAYDLAYRGAPPEFFTQYKVTQIALRNAVKTIAAVLIKNKLSTSRDMLLTQKVAQDLCDKFLVKSWGILANDYSIKEPSNNKIAKVWSALNSQITVSAKDIQLRSLLEELFNPPFGYDYNTALLLIGAWLGFNSLEVKYTINGTLNPVDEVVALLTNAKGVKEFLEAVSARQTLAISRINLGDVINEVKEKVTQAHRETFKQVDARVLIQELEVHSQNEALNEEIRSQASIAATHLLSALQKADDYDIQAREIVSKVNNKKLSDLTNIPNQLQKLPVLGNVIVAFPTPEELRDTWQKQLAETVEHFCHEYETVDELTEIGRNKEILTQGKKDIKRVAPDQVKRFDLALETLVQDEQRLRARDQEAPVRVEIETMKTQLPYFDLIDFQTRLEAIKGFSDETMELRDKKLAQIRMEISQLETYATGLMKSVDSLKSRSEVESWKIQYLQVQNRFEGSRFQKELEKTFMIANNLLEFYFDLEQIDKTRYYTPEEIDLAFVKVTEIEKKNSKWLSEESKKALDQIRSKLDDIKNKQEAEAIKWTQSVIQASDKGNYQLVLQKSKVIPPFLPESEKKKIYSLVLKAETEIEKDIVAKIEHEFQQIKDRDIQQECLKRLQAIVSKVTVNTK